MLSFVLPVYNCKEQLAAGLPDLLACLKEGGWKYRIIIVDDGSADGAAIQSLAAGYGCTYIRNPKNRGKGFAIRNGFRQADGDYFVFMDGDFPFATASVAKLLAELTHSGAEMVIGDRT